MRTQIKSVSIALICSATIISCASHYQVSGVERQRVLIDKTFDAEPDVKAAEFIKPYKVKVDSIMCPVMGRSAKYMMAHKPESELSNLLADILIWSGSHYGENPQIAIYNIGGIRAALNKGEVTYGDILEIAPFENKICFLSLTGTDLIELMKQIAHTRGQGISHGVKMEISPDGKLLSMKLNGEEIASEKTYRIATLDYLAQGNDGLTAFKKATNKVINTSEKGSVRFLIMDYFRALHEKGQEVDAKIENRIKVIK
jgi:2',3'-cyclic-nucleotide 2'-phosphodiesterase (5'-nucleotidase family)